ncbi:MAG: DEAD/DEAH box helicase [Alphaproteobacteria bacterium]|nr:DEAD/DEAH box helicase [Alphaproteobacteria bacterium]MBQ8677769.1 DEAD/DEAH box helicase [Alphaproteobacteria bacterium]
MKFTDLGLSKKTIQAIEEFGIKEPTTVQSDVIPSILQGKDVFTIAPQRCGKTTSYVFPLIDIISAQKKNIKNILIITSDSEQSVVVSDRLAIFNKYHEINEATIKDKDEDIDNEANVIIGSPDLLIELVGENRIDLAKINILVVDDINLIKKNKQLDNLEKILELLPAEKQNIVYTNRRSKETQSILDKILKAPEEIKVNKDKEQEASQPAVKKEKKEEKNTKKTVSHKRKAEVIEDKEALELMKKYNSFNGKTPRFLLNAGVIVPNE